MDILFTDLQIRGGNQCYGKYHFSYFSTNTYVVGAQMKRLNETVLLNIQRMDKKILSLSCDEIYSEKQLKDIKILLTL